MIHGGGYETGQGTGSASDNSNEMVKLHEEMTVAADGTTTPTALTADVTEQDDFSVNDSGNVSDETTSSGSDDKASGDFTDHAAGTDSEQIHLAGVGDNETATVQEQLQDNYSDTVDESGNFDDTTTDPGTGSQTTGTSGTGSSSALIDHFKGMLAEHESDSGNETATLQETLAQQNGTWTLASVAASLTSQAKETDSDSGDGTDDESGASETDHGQEHIADSETQTDNTQVHFEGTGNNLTATVNEKETDNYSDSDNAEGNDASSTGTSGAGTSTGTSSDNGSYSTSDNGSWQVTVQEALAYSNSTWALTSATVDASDGGGAHESDSGASQQNAGAGSTGGSDQYSDGDNETLSDTTHETSDGTTTTTSEDQSRVSSFSNSDDQEGTGTPADGATAEAANVTFTLHRDIVTDANGTDTLSNAVLDVTGSFRTGDGQAATFGIHVTGGGNTFTTTIDETNTDIFQNLNVTVDATDGWLDNFVSEIDGMIQGAATGSGTAASSGGQSSNGTTAANSNSSDPNAVAGTTTQTVNGVTQTQTYNAVGAVLSNVYTEANGKVLESHSATYDASGNKLTQTDGDQTTAWTYDSAGHQITETVGYGTDAAETTRFVYQGNNLVQVIDPDGNTTSYGYDDGGTRHQRDRRAGQHADADVQRARADDQRDERRWHAPRPDVQRTGAGDGRDVVRRRRRDRGEPVELRLRREWPADQRGQRRGDVHLPL